MANALLDIIKTTLAMIGLIALAFLFWISKK